MVNYNNGKVYKIEPIGEHDEGDVYIGSTTKRLLSQRLSKHKSNYREFLNGKRRNVSLFKLFNKYGIQNCRSVLLETVYANNKDELFSREAYYIQNLKCVNIRIPGIQRTVINCECGCCFLHISRHSHIKSKKHLTYLNNLTFEYYWDDGSPCTEEDYNNSTLILNKK